MWKTAIASPKAPICHLQEGYITFDQIEHAEFPNSFLTFLVSRIQFIPPRNAERS
jgi:hypothetical protein